MGKFLARWQEAAEPGSVACFQKPFIRVAGAKVVFVQSKLEAARTGHAPASQVLDCSWYERGTPVPGSGWDSDSVWIQPVRPPGGRFILVPGIKPGWFGVP